MYFPFLEKGTPFTISLSLAFFNSRITLPSFTELTLIRIFPLVSIPSASRISNGKTRRAFESRLIRNCFVKQIPSYFREVNPFPFFTPTDIIHFPLYKHLLFSNVYRLERSSSRFKAFGSLVPIKNRIMIG